MKISQMGQRLLKNHKFIKQFLFTFLFLIAGEGCTSAEQREMNEAKLESDRGQFRIALSHLEKVIIRSPQSKLGIEAAREAARISYFELQDFPRAAQFYRQLVLSSQNPQERMNAQK